jgi:hypothetical protein
MAQSKIGVLLPTKPYLPKMHCTLEALAALNYNTIGLDWTLDPIASKKNEWAIKNAG